MDEFTDRPGRRRPLWPWFILALALAGAIASFFAYVPR
jgi:hypothetical protein